VWLDPIAYRKTVTHSQADVMGICSGFSGPDRHTVTPASATTGRSETQAAGVFAIG